MVVEYNRFMLGVDCLDQCMSYYQFARKSVRWWRKVSFCMVDAVVVIGRAGASPPSRLAGMDFYIFLYMSSGDTAFWSPWAPALRANVKPARSHPVTW